jgi:hypothetical protein
MDFQSDEKIKEMPKAITDFNVSDIPIKDEIIKVIPN